MPPHVATGVFVLGIIGLFYLDRDPKLKVSKALWIPIFWLLIAGSRNVGEWIQIGPPMDAGEQYLEGNPLDRDVLGGLVAIGVILLIRRGRPVAEILRRNYAVIVYFSYCAVSVLWSDYPFVGFKRWIRAAGDVVMVLIVLSDKDAVTAVKRLMSRAGFVLIPLSVLLIRYYPDLGRAYGEFDHAVSWTGVATTKNTLGMISMVFGISALWRLIGFWKERRTASKRILISQGVLFLMALWLIRTANSMTALSCFVIASVVVVAMSVRSVVGRPAMIHILVAFLIVASFSTLFLNVNSGALQSLGRDASLTGRTEVWGTILKVANSPVLGEGYESFWIGQRFQEIRRVAPGINQCHNGYLEVYVNLGLMGIFFIGTLIVAGYKHIMRTARTAPGIASLTLAYFVICVIYNFTESGAKMMSPVWISFLLSIMATSPPAVRRAPNTNRKRAISDVDMLDLQRESSALPV
jgi:exopolysaccharide production protein ExoQ